MAAMKKKSPPGRPQASPRQASLTAVQGASTRTLASSTVAQGGAALTKMLAPVRRSRLETLVRNQASNVLILVRIAGVLAIATGIFPAGSSAGTGSGIRGATRAFAPSRTRVALAMVVKAGPAPQGAAAQAAPGKPARAAQAMPGKLARAAEAASGKAARAAEAEASSGKLARVAPGRAAQGRAGSAARGREGATRAPRARGARAARGPRGQGRLARASERWQLAGRPRASRTHQGW